MMVLRWFWERIFTKAKSDADAEKIPESGCIELAS